MQDGVKEKDINLSIALIVKDCLVKCGHLVAMTRETDIYPTLQKRCQIANEHKSDVFVSVHCNRVDVNVAAQGAEAWYFDTSWNGAALASEIMKSVIHRTEAGNRGIKGTSELYVLKHTNMPAVLVECGFLSNKEELAKLITPKYQSIMGASIARGIEEYFKLKPIKG